LTSREKTIVLAHGSSNGVDAARFAPNDETRARIRRELGFADSDVVIGFIGRLTRDKGIAELLQAFERVRNARLLIVGDAEDGDPVDAATLAKLAHVTRLAHVADAAPYYSAIDILAFPSHREGFPNVVLEAASASVPAVGFRATGTVDAIEDGVTGTIVDDVDALAIALQRYVDDESLRRAHGEAGRKRAVERFAPEEVWRALQELMRDETARLA
ncbi:MAG TPA: glycosyltransferase, partial [Thermoanaerobaculia bacterium]|nr:glycosyltransferase [Thermoanaerobaculia bacterium]